jgi:mycoredoxin
MSTSGIDFYGASWCGDCVRARALLEHYGVDFNYHDIDASEDAKAEAISISGLPKIPVLRFSDGTFLSEPSNPALGAKLAELDLIDKPE